MKGKYPTYRDRNDLLVKLGYKDYQEYLKSPQWELIKRTVFKMKGNRCYICGKDATVLHHRGYGIDTLIGKNLDPIVPLCDGCHRTVEFTKKGEKRTLRKAEVTYNALVAIKNGKLKKWRQDLRVKKPGYCITCGNVSKRNMQYCTPCANKAGVKIIKLCHVCKDAPKLEDNKLCRQCMSRYLRAEKIGLLPKKQKNRYLRNYGNVVNRKIAQYDKDNPIQWYRVQYDSETGKPLPIPEE